MRGRLRFRMNNLGGEGEIEKEIVEENNDIHLLS